MRQHPRGPGEVHDQDGDPARGHGESREGRAARELLELHEQQEDQPIQAEQHERVAALVGLPRRLGNLPGARVHDLQHPAEAEPERTRS